MPHAGFFARFGLLAIPDFFTADECAGVRREMQASPGQPATVRVGGGNYEIDSEWRSADWASVCSDTAVWVDSRLRDLRSRLEIHFGIALAGMENPQFLVYGPGGFYRPHRDNTRDPAAAEISRLRKVSVVLFLNSPSEEPGAGSYSGGSLVFYDLMRHADGRMPGLPLIPAEGLLVGFRSELLHGVTPVTSGQRYTLVTWYY